jgi:hypothetical protein
LLTRSLALSNWTDLSCQRIKLVGERCASNAFNPELVLADHVHELDAGEHVGRSAKGYEPSIGLITRLIARWSCSTILLRYLTCRTVTGKAIGPLILSIAALLTPLLSIAIFSGPPFSRIAFSKKRLAAAVSRCAVSKKSTVFPSLSTGR